MRRTAAITAGLAAAFLVLAPAGRAESKLFFENKTSEPLCIVDTIVTHKDPGIAGMDNLGSQPTLGGDSWRHPEGGDQRPGEGCQYVVAPGSRIMPLVFDPDDSPSGKSTWFLTRVRTRSGQTTVLKQKVDGEPFDYTMWFGIDDERLVKVQDSRQGYTWSMAKNEHGQSRTMRVEYERFDVAGDDDFEYVFLPGEQRGEGTRFNGALQVVAVHTGFLSLTTRNLKTRAALLPKALGKYFDVVVLTGLVEGRTRVALREAMRPAYPYATRVGNDGGAIKEDGGVVIFSRLPIVSDDARALPAVEDFDPDIAWHPSVRDALGGALDDTGTMLSYDAAVHAKIEVAPGKHVHVIGTTTGAREGMRSQGKHIQVVKDMVRDKVPADASLVVAGDHLAELGYSSPRQLGHATTNGLKTTEGDIRTIGKNVSQVVVRPGVGEPDAQSFLCTLDVETAQTGWGSGTISIADGMGMFAYLSYGDVQLAQLVAESVPAPAPDPSPPGGGLLGFEN